MSRNELVMSGVVLSREPLRYTPAGIPVVSFVLQHASRQREAGGECDAKLEITVQVLGATTHGLETLQPGTPVLVGGFLARRSLKSRQIVLHANRYKFIDGDEYASPH